MNAQEISSSHNHLIQLNIEYNFWLAHNPTCPSQNTAKLQYAEIMLLSIRDNASSLQWSKWFLTSSPLASNLDSRIFSPWNVPFSKLSLLINKENYVNKVICKCKSSQVIEEGARTSRNHFQSCRIKIY